MTYTYEMRILLTEGSGLTSRQVATRLGELGHDVGILTSDPWCLTRFSRSVRRRHEAPPFGADPSAWLDRAVAVYVEHGYEVLFPTQEQVTVLAAEAARLGRAGVRTAVPSFAALVAVQDKLAAHATLTRLGLPQPASWVLADRAALAAWDQFPVFVKTPIGTATSGVRRVGDAVGLASLARDWDRDAAWDAGGVLVQEPVIGPLAMVQAVFDRGRLVTAHVNLRVREGARGGASHKQGVERPDVIALLDTLGRDLDWHGALSADAILTAGGPVLIDINPRLVEPANGWRDGVDLVGALCRLATGDPVGSGPGPTAEAGPPGARTHQLLLAVLGAAQAGRGRRGVAAELAGAVMHRGSYGDSVEELTPWSDGWRAVAPVVAALAVTLAHPPSWSWLSDGSVTSYAVSPDGWRSIRAHADVPGRPG